MEAAKEDEHDEEQDELAHSEAMAHRPLRWPNLARILVKSDFGVGGNHIGRLAHTGEHRIVVVARLQVRDEGTPDVAVLPSGRMPSRP